MAPPIAMIMCEQYVTSLTPNNRNECEYNRTFLELSRTGKNSAMTSWTGRNVIWVEAPPISSKPIELAPANKEFLIKLIVSHAYTPSSCIVTIACHHYQHEVMIGG
jgi:hypothetical protein